MKRIPAQLRNHLAGDVHTVCYLMRIDCKGSFAGTTIGFSTLDANVIYDDGLSVVEYKASNGFTQERIQSSAEYTVDNTDVSGWVTDTGVTDQMIHAGIFDYADIRIYRINYMQPTPSSHELVNLGTLGQTIFDEQQWRCEFRSLMQQAKQPQSTIYSLTCRAAFGDEKCGMPLAWVSSTVTDYSDDPRRLFQAATLNNPDHYWAPGVVEWLTGDNAGIQMEVEDSWSDGGVRLALPMPFDIKPGDTFRIRRDCKKTFEACKEYGNVVNFRGEHLTPIADTALSVPGAYIKQVGSK